MANNTSSENQVQEKKKNKKLIIFATILGIVMTIGIIYFIHAANFVTSDNAQLDADIVQIKSSVPGYIKSINFKDNEKVKKGQLLILIDDTDLKTRVAQAEAALENAKAGLIEAQNKSTASFSNANASNLNTGSIGQSVNSAMIVLNKAKDDFTRTSNLFQAKAATKAQFDAAKSELDLAQAKYEIAQSQFKASAAQSKGVYSQAEAQKAAISLSEAMIKQRQAELALANTQLNNANIYAPCDGIVTKRAVEFGQYITVAQPLCSIIDNQHTWVTANFKETQVEHLKIGQPVEIKLDAFPKLKLSGTIESFIGATGAKFSLLPPDNSTGNFVKIVQRVPVKIALNPVPKNSNDILFPGLSAFVEVKIN